MSNGLPDGQSVTPPLTLGYSTEAPVMLRWKRIRPWVLVALVIILTGVWYNRLFPERPVPNTRWTYTTSTF